MNSVSEVNRTEAEAILDNLISHKMPSLGEMISQRDAEKVGMFCLEYCKRANQPDM